MEKEEKQTKITTPMAIIVAGVLVMVGILLSGGINVEKKEKTLSQQLGISKEKITECLANSNQEEIYNKFFESVSKATSLEGFGTPYMVIASNNGLKTEVRGAESYENFKKIISDMSNGNVTTPYEGGIVLDEEGDHVFGNPNAPIKIIEYSDYQCGYCSRVHPVLEQIVNESNGQVSWTFRHLPILGQDSLTKAMVGECVAQIKGNDAFWKYSKIIFDSNKPAEQKSFTESL